MENSILLNLRPSDVPASFTVCFNNECPHRDKCLRHTAGQAITPHRDHGTSVFPGALKADGQCRFFFQKRIIRAAWGFRPLFCGVRHEDYAPLRQQVMALFGSDRRFYRFNNGEYKLTPERQAEVLAVFKRFGYDTTDLRFAHYEELVDFIE